MKFLLKVKFTLDGEPLVWGAECNSPGTMTVNLARDEMGGVTIVGADIVADESYQEAIKSAFDAATVYHEKLADLQAFGQALNVELHYLHKFIAPEIG